MTELFGPLLGLGLPKLNHLIYSKFSTGFGMLVFLADSSLTWNFRSAFFMSSFLPTRRLSLVLDGKSSQEYPVTVGVPQVFVLGCTLFLLYINGLPDDVVCNTTVYAVDPTVFAKCEQAPDLWKQLELTSELESGLRDTKEEAENSSLISTLEKLNLFCLISLLTLRCN